jgi:hypothetical protein
MVRPRGNAVRLPSAAKSLSVFGKKIADGASRFHSAGPGDVAGWSMVRVVMVDGDAVAIDVRTRMSQCFARSG